MPRRRTTAKRRTPDRPGRQRNDRTARDQSGSDARQRGITRGGPNAKPQPPRMSPRQLEELVGRLFCQKLRAAQIVEHLAQCGIRIARSDVYNRFIPACIERGLVRYAPPLAHTLEAQFKRDYPWLKSVRVVHAIDVRDVANVAAEEILSVLRRDFAGKGIHLGFAGGHTVAEFAWSLDDLLRTAPMPLPSELWLHILVGALSVSVSADPVVFCSQLADDKRIPIPRKLIRFNAPLIVPKDAYDKVLDVEKLDRAFRTKDLIDIVVTSASPWDADSVLRQSLEECAEEARKAAADEGRDPSTVPGPFKNLEPARGDLLNRPLGDHGEIENAEYRVTGVLNIKDLSHMVAAGKRVVLIIGPTSTGRTRTGILRTILRLRDHHISDLIVDERCAQELLDSSWNSGR